LLYVVPPPDFWKDDGRGANPSPWKVEAVGLANGLNVSSVCIENLSGLEVDEPEIRVPFMFLSTGGSICKSRSAFRLKEFPR